MSQAKTDHDSDLDTLKAENEILKVQLRTQTAVSAQLLKEVKQMEYNMELLKLRSSK